VTAALRTTVLAVARHSWAAKATVGLALLAGFAVIPLVTTSFYTSLALNILIFGLLAMSLDLMAGYTGMFSFGHAAYLGLGAYGIGYGEKRLLGPLSSVGFSFLVVLAVALVFGLVAVRVSGLTFGIVTMSLSGILWGLAFRWVVVSGGDNGLSIPVRPTIGPFDLTDDMTFYYSVLVVLTVCSLLMMAIVHSPFGLSLRGIKENEQRMRTLGYSVGLHKYVVYVISAIFAGIAGMLFGLYSMYVDPSALDMNHNFLVVMMTVLGGLGTLWGSLIGAAVIVGSQQWLSYYFARWAMVLGGVFVLTVLFARAGLFGTISIVLRRLVRWAEGDADEGRAAVASSALSPPASEE